MTRLNKKMKDQIIANAIEKAGINNRQEKLKKWRAEWAEKVRVDSLGGPENDKKIQSIKKRFEKAISDLPKDVTRGGIFCHSNLIYANVVGYSIPAYFNGEEKRTGEQVYKVTPHGHTVKQGSKLAVEFSKIEECEKDIRHEKDTVEAVVSGALSRVSTVKKLLEVWPESAELLPKDLSAAKANMPAVKVEELNKIIGLPSEKSE